jgi:hypothetical protein
VSILSSGSQTQFGNQKKYYVEICAICVLLVRRWVLGYAHMMTSVAVLELAEIGR